MLSNYALGTMVNLDRKSRIPLYQQISEQLRQQITQGLLSDGSFLPPERTLARMLGINRSTVVNAYGELAALGLVEPHVGRGTRVRRSVEQSEKEVIQRTLPWPELLLPYSESVSSKVLREIVALCSRQEIISLAAGIPNPDYYPHGDFAALFQEILAEHGGHALEHCPPEGHYQLREALARRFSASLPVSAPQLKVDDILVLSGSQQGIYLIAGALLGPADLVITENPTFLGALSVFKAFGARIAGIPVDEEGMRIDVLAQVLERRRPRLIYTVPTFQNPSGVVLSLARRRQLLALARAYKVPILEDDPYKDMYYDSATKPPPSLKALDLAEGGNQVIYLNSFAKNLFPGMRLGWMAAPPAVIERSIAARQLIDLHTTSLYQWALARYLERGMLDKHLEMVRGKYRDQRDAMAKALDHYCGDTLERNQPQGGFYFWCAIKSGENSFSLLERAARHNIAFVPGSGLAVPGATDCDNRIRLNFAVAKPEVLEEGIRRLGAVLKIKNPRPPAPLGPRQSSGLELKPLV
ncbi:MAG TPA: PLP-dependent aminotransferase family protein [Chloroflexia bacterium]|nr:PLP-dependent aminotransferase family protein [Chloroflexia bacterium]